MNQLKIIERNILAIIERLKELETVEYRESIKSKEQYDITRQFATEMFRKLLIDRDREREKREKLKSIKPPEN
jgi:hypothetical protein